MGKSTRRGLKALICSLSLPDPGHLPLRPDGPEPHPHLTAQHGSACKHCGLRSTSEKVLVTHIKAVHKDTLAIAVNQKHHWLRDPIQEGIHFRSWAANDVRRSWIIDKERSGLGLISSNALLQASPDAVKKFAQQLFTEGLGRLDEQSGEQSGEQRPLHTSTPASSVLLTNWMQRTGKHNRPPR